MTEKSTPEAISHNFDQQVDRFLNIETGQSTAIDSPLCMELVSQTAKILCPNAENIMDLGCGGGNYAFKVASLMPTVNCTLIDISRKMVEAAEKRLQNVVLGKVTAICGDYRNVPLEENHYDIVTAGTTLHHLRQDDEWENVFKKVFKSLKDGGIFCINDIVLSEDEAVDQLMLNGWISLLKKQVPDEVDLFFGKYESEDSPRSLNYQLDLMRTVGFSETMILHKHFNFVTFLGRKK